MSLNGYRRASGKRSGGVKSVALIEAGALADVRYDAAGGSCTSVSGVFAAYHFKEDEARYTETVSGGAGPATVKHELTLSLERMDGQTRRAVEELLADAGGGFVAVVTTSNDVSLLVGCSRKFGAEYPLRLAKSVGTTGSALTDTTAESIVLTSTDASKALVFTGSVM